MLHQKEITAGKGKQGENCNVTHCQKPKSAKHYNKVMHAWYCYECATKIEAAARRDGQSFYDDLAGSNVKLSAAALDTD